MWRFVEKGPTFLVSDLKLGTLILGKNNLKINDFYLQECDTSTFFALLSQLYFLIVIYF